MSAIRLPLFHVVYTNAPGADGIGGFRFLAVHFGGAQEDRKPIDDWLKRLEPAPGSRQGWAANSFRVAGVRCAALAVVDPSFAVDESERGGGRLAHALVVPLEEGKPIGHFGRALYETALRFLEEGRSSRSLVTYLEGCRLVDEVDIPQIRPDELDRLFDLMPVVQALVDAGNDVAQEVSLPGFTDEEALPEKILEASAALPPCLRLALRWRVGLQAGGEGFAVRPGAAGTAQTGRFGAGQVYTDDLWRRLQEKRADELAGIVNRNWEIKEWKPLPAASHGVPAVEPPQDLEPVTLETEPMKREKTSGGGKSTPAPRQSTRTAAEYDREQESLYDEMRSYIDQRLQNMGAPPPPSRRSLEAAADPNTGGGVAAPSSWVKTLLEWRPEVYLLLVLLLMAGMYRKLQPPPSPPVKTEGAGAAETGSGEPASKASTEERERPDEPAQVDPVAQWKTFVDEQPTVAAKWLRAVATNEGLGAKQVSVRQRQAFGTFADRLDARGFLKPEEVPQAATGLFEYVHALWAREQKIGDPGRDVVTLDPGEVGPRLAQLAASLEMGDQIKAGAKPDDPQVQTAIVLRWIERHPKL